MAGVHAFWFDAFESFDAGTKAYIKATNEKIAVVERVAVLTDYQMMNELYKMYGTIDALFLEMGNCPLRFSTSKADRNYCKTRWLLKKKPLYPFLYK